MSSVLRSIESHSGDRVFRKPIMSRTSKTSVVAGRVAVAPQTKTEATAVGEVAPALDVAAQVMADLRDPGQLASEQAGRTCEPVAPTRRRRLPSLSEREQAERRLERRIRAHLPKGELSVRLTDNRYTMISVRRDTTDSGKQYKVRLHHMFISASPVITRALARYVALNDKEASRLLGEFIDGNQQFVRTRVRRTAEPKMVTAGQVHDLLDIFEFLNARYFGNTIQARITWGQRNRKPLRRNSIKMGSYSVEERLIRIHRSLDRTFVPRFFVEWVVYHEMLHQVHEIKVVNGRRLFHSREFLRDEAKFDHYREAREWERANLDALLTY